MAVQGWMNLLLDKAGEGSGGTGGGATDSSSKEVEGKEIDVTQDNFGYEKSDEEKAEETKVAAAAKEKKENGASGYSSDDDGKEKTDEEKAADIKAAEEAKKKESVSGYGEKTDEQKAAEQKQLNDAAVAEAAKKKDEKSDDKDEITPLLEGLPENDAKDIKDFATEHKLNKDQTKAFVDLRKKENLDAEQFQKDQLEKQKKNLTNTRASWVKELKEHKDFGGDKFERNVAKVDKVLDELLPETSKALKDNKGVLPPNVMRDLAKVHDKIFGTEGLTTGKATAEVKPDEDDVLAFYSMSESEKTA